MLDYNRPEISPTFIIFYFPVIVQVFPRFKISKTQDQSRVYGTVTLAQVYSHKIECLDNEEFVW